MNLCAHERTHEPLAAIAEAAAVGNTGRRHCMLINIRDIADLPRKGCIPQPRVAAQGYWLEYRL